jgi:Protein of unknown function (DUF3568)
MRPELSAPRLALAGGMACVLWLSGCATVAPTSEATTRPTGEYTGGRAIMDFPGTAKIASAAAAEALEDLKMTSIKRSRDGTVYKIEAQTEDNRSVLVTVRPHQEQARIACRVGWFGDELLSKAIVERIGIRLELLPPAPIPDKPPTSPDPNPFLMRDKTLKDGMIRDMIEAPYRDRPGP